MKRFLTSVLAFGLMMFLGGMVKAQAPSPSPAPSPQPVVKPAPVATAPAEAAPMPGGGIFKFEEETHDFGELIQGGDASYTFKFTNVGTEAITIKLAKGSCGCTVPTWPKEPIPPGGTGEIAVRYDSNRIGIINKNVTITSNASETAKLIYIKGNISPKPAEPTFTAPATAPENK